MSSHDSRDAAFSAIKPYFGETSAREMAYFATPDAQEFLSSEHRALDLLAWLAQNYTPEDVEILLKSDQAKWSEWKGLELELLIDRATWHINHGRTGRVDYKYCLHLA